MPATPIDVASAFVKAINTEDLGTMRDVCRWLSRCPVRRGGRQVESGRARPAAKLERDRRVAG